MKKMLTVGSIVELKGENADKVMIAGYHVKTKDGRIFDYFAVPYPLGMMTPSEYLLINENVISDVVFEGYGNHDSEVYLNALSILEKKFGEIASELSGMSE